MLSEDLTLADLFTVEAGPSKTIKVTPFEAALGAGPSRSKDDLRGLVDSFIKDGSLPQDIAKLKAGRAKERKIARILLQGIFGQSPFSFTLGALLNMK